MKTKKYPLILILLFVAGSVTYVSAQIPKKVIEKAILIGETPIDKKYRELGGESGILGKPKTEEKYSPDNVTKFRHFERGSIYFQPDYVPAAIYGEIYKKWAKLGWEAHPIGFPTTDEKTTPDRKGRYNFFENGVILWRQGLGTFEIHGEIFKKWMKLNGTLGVLGYPITDERATPDKTGRYNHFENGSIYWHPKIGAVEVHGEILKKWAELGYERSILGYPISDEMATPGKDERYNRFERGTIYWTPSNGAVVELKK